MNNVLLLQLTSDFSSLAHHENRSNLYAPTLPKPWILDPRLYNKCSNYKKGELKMNANEVRCIILYDWSIRNYTGTDMLRELRCDGN